MPEGINGNNWQKPMTGFQGEINNFLQSLQTLSFETSSSCVEFASKMQGETALTPEQLFDGKLSEEEIATMRYFASVNLDEKPEIDISAIEDFPQQAATFLNYNKADDEVVERREINDENKEEIMEEFKFTAPQDVEEFNKLYEKYDAEVIITENGEEIVRFKDEQGRPIKDFVYGKEGDEDNYGRTENIYTYFEDGSYKVDHVRNFAVWEEMGDPPKQVWQGFYDDGVYYIPGYYDAEGNEINDVSK